jgi:hypothetical protein
LFDKNPWNKARAITLATALQLETNFLKKKETIESFFNAFEYGSSAMTMRSQYKNHGDWVEQAVFTKMVEGIYLPFIEHFEKVGFIWETTSRKAAD